MRTVLLNSRKADGFTLIEVLVAVLIFALLTAAAYASVDVLLRSRQALHVRAESLQNLQTALGRLERDLRQTLSAPVRDEYGEALDLLRGGTNAIELTRAGLSNPLGVARARIERVQWALQDDALSRASFGVLDRAVNSRPQIATMLSNVQAIRFSYFDGGQWRNQWPRPDVPTDQPRLLPIAVAFEIDTADYGLLRRIVPLVEPSARTAAGAPGPGPAGAQAPSAQRKMETAP
jgi:general secretion pathway protein J